MDRFLCLHSDHDDDTKWKHFPRYWPFVWGSHRSRWIPHTKASDAELWCFLWSAPEKTVEYTIERLVIWDSIAPIMTSSQWLQQMLQNQQWFHRTNTQHRVENISPASGGCKMHIKSTMIATINDTIPIYQHKTRTKSMTALYRSKSNTS